MHSVSARPRSPAPAAPPGTAEIMNDSPQEFQDVDCTSLTFKIKEAASFKNTYVQTEAVSSFSVSSGKYERAELYTQTNLTSSADLVGKDSGEHARLPLAIERLATLMVKELEAPDDEFSGYAPLLMPGHHSISCRYTLTSKNVLKANLKCVAVSWNATGTMICAAFGKSRILGWCDERGIICCWHLFRENFSPNLPSHTFNHYVCFTSLACHPKTPALFAAGTFNGEILIYDLASSHDMLKAVSDVGEYTHREPVAALDWVGKSLDWQLVSISCDCIVLWWSLASMRIVSSQNSGHLPYPVRSLEAAQSHYSGAHRYVG